MTNKQIQILRYFLKIKLSPYGTIHNYCSLNKRFNGLLFLRDEKMERKLDNGKSFYYACGYYSRQYLIPVTCDYTIDITPIEIEKIFPHYLNTIHFAPFKKKHWDYMKDCVIQYRLEHD